MSAKGHNRTFLRFRTMSALLPKADSRAPSRNVRFGPEADSCSAAKPQLFDHLVGAAKQ
jgi:hypothetical protein